MTKKQKATSAWAVIIIGFLGGVALANVQNKVPPVIDVIMAYFNIGETDAGWLTSVFTIMGMATAIPASWLMRKMGPKKIGVVSLACAVVGSTVGALSNTLSLLIATRIVEGIGVGMIAVVGPTLIAMWFPPEKRGLPMGLWGSWMGTSQTLLFLISGTLAAAYGWQGVWWFTTVFCAIVLILFQWKVDAPPRGTPNYAIDEENEEDFHFGDGFKSVSTLLLTLSCLLFTLACFGFSTYISLHWAKEFFGGDMNVSNGWVSLMYAIEIPAAILIGLFLDHIEMRKRRYVGVIGYAGYAVILFLSSWIDSPAFILPYVIIFPIVEASIPATYFTISPSTAKKPQHAATAVGIMNVGLNIGTLVGPPLIGYFIESYDWTMAVIPMSAAAALAAVLFFFVKTYDTNADTELE